MTVHGFSIEPGETARRMLRMVRKLLKWGAALLVALVLYLFVAAKFGTYAERYECKGVFTYPDGTEVPQTIYIRITYYRWFLFWAGDGDLWAEIPNRYSTFYPRIREADDDLYILESNGEQRGHLSKLSNALNLKSASGGVFQGVCVKVSK